MPDWLIERGIGETRAVRVEHGEIVEARLFLDGIARAGERLQGRLARASVPSIVEVEGQEYLLPKGAMGGTQGASVTIEVTRERIPGAEPWKRPLARIADGNGAESTLDGDSVQFPAPEDRLAAVGWYDLIEEARSGIVRFAGGELRISPTPAMTLIDVDGTLPPVELALAGASAAARTILRHDIGGSIGIDLPTIAGKTQRQQVGERVDAVLPPPFERTAVNGFGFLQVVRPRRRASLFELALDRPGFEARALLRRTALERSGVTQLVANP
ncbi:MAG: ribonuclease, partial [Sphingomonas sp.]|nr:ribonuclease [Sphingomonas sp.]